MSFADSLDVKTVGMKASVNKDLGNEARLDMPLTDFFSRPVQIFSTVWAPGTSLNPLGVNITFDPWSLFFENQRNANRVVNYRNLRCNLKVKFLINGNQFYYGRALVFYVPGYTFDTFYVNTNDKIGLCCNSQRMHAFLDPCDSKGFEMTLPFVYKWDYLSVPDKAWSEMGNICISDFATLKHANGGLEPITITAYAWAEDVELTVPTTVGFSNILPQCDTEDDAGLISAPATAAARAAGALKTLPVIGSYARATEMLARSVAGSAKAFGFSRPVSLPEPARVDVNYIGTMSTADGADNANKLTIDRQQELTIDPATFGLDIGDEMSVSSIATRRSWIYTMNWPTNALNTSTLLRLAVAPGIKVGVSTGYAYPALGFLSSLFTYWRGSLKYTFQVVCSNLHRGRLLIQYDPANVAAIEPNVSISKIVDISNTKEFSIVVPWTQNVHYKALGAGQYDPAWVTTGPNFTNTSANGQILVSVLNSLSDPNSAVNNDIYVNVYIEACDDFELAVAQNTWTTTLPKAYATAQADEEDNEHEHTEMEVRPCAGNGSPGEMLTYIGESYNSLRQLLKRYSMSNAYYCPVTTTPQINSILMYPFPVYRGKNKLSLGSDNTPIPTNFGPLHILNYVTPCFYAYRGSVRNIFVSDGNIVPDLIVAERGKSTLTRETQTSTTNASVSASTTANFYSGAALKLTQGGALTVAPRRPTLTVESPFYSLDKFRSARNILSTSPNVTFGPEVLYVNTHLPASAAANSSRIIRYTGVGEDFSLFWYQHPPVITATPALGVPSATG